MLQLHKSYIVTEDEEGIVIVDQHALHERVMFEQLFARVFSSDGKLESQRLLMPVIMDLGEKHQALIEELAPLLATWAVMWIARLDDVASVLGALGIGKKSLVADMESYVRGVEDPKKLDAKKLASILGPAFSMLNPAKAWVTLLFPHCFSKIHRVKYGLLRKQVGGGERELKPGVTSSSFATLLRSNFFNCTVPVAGGRGVPAICLTKVDSTRFSLKKAV